MVPSAAIMPPKFGMAEVLISPGAIPPPPLLSPDQNACPCDPYQGGT